MEDKKCSICKTELEEVLVTSNKALTWAEFEKRWRKKAIEDEEDNSIMYDNKQAQAAGTELRSLQCLMFNCNNTHVFPNVESLRRHLEQVH
jgi:hypothetical protein